MAKTGVLSGPWTKGINSSLPPQFLPDQQLVWTTNAITRAGVTTRPGFRCLPDNVGRDEAEPRGLNIFTPLLQNPYLVKAVGQLVRVADISSDINPGWSTIAEINEEVTPVYFANCIKGASFGVAIAQPYPVMIVQTGQQAPFYWDGHNVGGLAEFGSPVGTIMKWFGSRLWTAVGPKLFASDLLDPVKHTETDTLTGGGYLQFNGDITGLGATSDNQNLIVFTSNQTSAVQGAILDRSTWGDTPGFQKVILDGIGCISPNSIVNQYGMLWWMSEHGLVALDEALHAFRSSQMHFRDGNMARSRGNMSADVSRIALGTFENFLVASVPSGDSANAHNWVMDQGPLDDITNASQPIWSSNWTGIRPVQWVDAVINGVPRIFALSRDYKITGDDADWTSNVWECFTKNKFDVGTNHDCSQLIIKPIQCSLEPKSLSPKDGGYATYGWFEILTSGMAGASHWDAFYSSSHSSYKQVLSRDIVATVDSMDSAQDLPAIVPAFLPQTRRIVTDADEAMISDNDPGVEDVYTRNKDRSFNVLIKWRGIATIWAVILVLDQRGDTPTDKKTDNEDTDRYVSPGGTSSFADSLNSLHSLASGQLSAPITVYGSRTPEDFYSSMP